MIDLYLTLSKEDQIDLDSNRKREIEFSSHSVRNSGLAKEEEGVLTVVH